MGGWVVAWGKPPTQGQVNADAEGQWQVGTSHPDCHGATQVDSSDDSRPGSDELLDALEQDLTVVAPKRRARRVFNDGEAVVHLSRGRFQVLSSDDPTPVDRDGAVEDPPSQCVAVAAPSVVDGGRVAQVVSRGWKRLRIVQNNVEDGPPPAVPPPDEVHSHGGIPHRQVGVFRRRCC